MLCQRMINRIIPDLAKQRMLKGDSLTIPFAVKLRFLALIL